MIKLKTWPRWTAANIIAMALLLVACGAPSPESRREAWAADPNYASAITVSLPDGRSVICVVYDNSSSGTNLSCDWDHAK